MQRRVGVRAHQGGRSSALVDQSAVRALIHAKLADGRLPLTTVTRVWGALGHGETCHACEEPIGNRHLVMEWINALGVEIEFHVACFAMWDLSRRSLDREGQPA